MTKTWFITGVSSGLGRAMTEKLLARGDRVAGTLRKPGVLQQLERQYGDRLWLRQMDVTDTLAVRRVVDEAFAALGKIDVVVSNAGYGLFGAAEEVSDEQIRAQIDTNLIGSIQVIRAAVPHLRKQGGGRILQVSSEGGQIAYPNFSLYHATKWGIEGFVEAVALEVETFNIQLTLIEPGATATDFGKSLVSPPPLEVYENTAVGAMRRAVKSGAGFTFADANKTVDAMIACADHSKAPRRLLLGGGSYDRMHAAFTARIAELEANEAITRSTDVDD
jgi:NAD(P)-dependent dehydrogenase (short-subunit alcohol dehydrogenase family)